MNDQRRRKIEDALAEASLELLMDDYTEQSGEILWQEFQSDADCVMPGDLDKACQDLIHTSFSKSVQESRGNSISARLKQLAPQACKAAMIAFAMVGAMATLTLSVEAIRVPVLNFFLTQENRYTIISSEYIPKEQTTACSFEDILSLIPSEYNIIYKKDCNNGNYLIRYENPQGYLISIRTEPARNQLYADTEDAEQEDVEINGFPALLIKKNGLEVIIEQANAGLRIDFYAEKLDESTFWKIALQLTE